MINKDNSLYLEIDKIKRKLISTYVYLMLIVLFSYSLIFYFFAENSRLTAYLVFGFCFFLYTWLITSKNYSISRLVHSYIIIATVFNLLIMVVFWKYSIGSYIWLLPIPLAGYIFFSKKAALYYTIYVIVNILIGYTLTRFFSFDILIFKSREQLVISDTYIFICNLAVILLLLYYNDKIRRIEIKSSLQKSEIKETVSEIENKITDNTEEKLKYDIIFDRIQKVVIEDKVFQDFDFNISKVSLLLNTNSNYISKAIKQNGYINFTNYINICRINYFKNLIIENDLRKITMMYLYTESGFSNQSTFNRVFKQIEGITPTEYVQNQKEKDLKIKS